jgi:hypothetical protein
MLARGSLTACCVAVGVLEIEGTLREHEHVRPSWRGLHRAGARAAPPAFFGDGADGWTNGLLPTVAPARALHMRALRNAHGQALAADHMGQLLRV